MFIVEFCFISVKWNEELVKVRGEIEKNEGKVNVANKRCWCVRLKNNDYDYEND